MKNTVRRVLLSLDVEMNDSNTDTNSPVPKTENTRISRDFSFKKFKEKVLGEKFDNT